MPSGRGRFNPRAQLQTRGIPSLGIPPSRCPRSLGGALRRQGLESPAKRPRSPAGAFSQPTFARRVPSHSGTAASSYGPWQDVCRPRRSRRHADQVDGDRQRIEVLFAETERTVAIDIDRDADSSDVLDAVTTALEIDDPVAAERALTDALEDGPRRKRGSPSSTARADPLHRPVTPSVRVRSRALHCGNAPRSSPTSAEGDLIVGATRAQQDAHPRRRAGVC
jgi:hypothetical protein